MDRSRTKERAEIVKLAAASDRDAESLQLLKGYVREAQREYFSAVLSYMLTAALSCCTSVVLFLTNTTFRSAGLAPQFAFILREDVKSASVAQPKQTYVLNIKKALMDVSVVALLPDPLPLKIPISAFKLTILCC